MSGLSQSTEHFLEVLVSAVVAITGTLGAKKGLEKTASRKTVPVDEGTKQLIIELRKQLTEVKKELATERRERQADNLRHQEQLDDIREEHTVQLDEVRAQLAAAQVDLAVLTRNASSQPSRVTRIRPAEGEA